MNTISRNAAKRRREQGFDLYVLGNQEVEVVVVPELGAKIISLKNLQTGREWLWHPQTGLKLFRNHVDDDFSQSPLVGIDECFPTIAPCSWQKRELPDHGELWNMPWEVDRDILKTGQLKTSAQLKVSPFEFVRTIELCGNEVRISYALTNLSAKEENFMWAIHPLLRLQRGDQLELPDTTRCLLNDQAWTDAITSALPEKECAKAFAAPVNEGWAAINNRDTGDRLQLEWNPEENNALGLWLTRGGWHGHHHFAIEPTNSDVDALTSAVERRCCGAIAALGSVNWQVCFRVGS